LSPRIDWISPADPPSRFPPASHALRDPNGLLAAGGDLSIERLLYAYRHGIFPWYSAGEPLLWWSPDPRCVLLPGSVHVSRRLARVLRQQRHSVRLNTCFEAVIDACAAPRSYGPGTWITAEMRAAFVALHRLGYAHSIEAWQGGELAGGLYGMTIGRVFFGESMFSARPDASKIVLARLGPWLEKHAFALIDCQVSSPHLETMGAIAMPRERFLQILVGACAQPAPASAWLPGTEI
jgi:leucyl/phenylalanyl-tRNA--protein transferase